MHHDEEAAVTKRKTLSPEEARKLATGHWEWMETLLRKVYIDSFIHGAKHASDRRK